MSRRVFITVGEVSGDRHAANFVRELKALEPDVVVEGLGGDAMRAAGVLVHHDTVRRSAMGLKAVLRAFEVKSLLAWTRRHHRESPPDLQVCIDSWSMNWHFARLGKKAGAPVLYYIAPQAWASRPGRVKRLRRFVDRLACILPFEEEWFRRQGVDARFVGHPLFDHLPAARPLPSADGFASRPPIIGLLPGSRRGVAKDNFPPLLDVAGNIHTAFPAATFLIPSTPNTHDVVMTELTRRGHAQAEGTFTVVQNGFDELVPRCDLCITVSGTATLHVAGYGVPMIVVYRGNRLLWHLIGRWVINTRTYSLVNLLNDSHKHIVPEFVPWYGNPGPVAEQALDYLRNPQKLSMQRERLQELVRSLDKPGASRNVAELAIELMNGRK